MPSKFSPHYRRFSVGRYRFYHAPIVTSLAFEQEMLVEKAKYGILLASLIAGTIGTIILKAQKA